MFGLEAVVDVAKLDLEPVQHTPRVLKKVVPDDATTVRELQCLPRDLLRAPCYLLRLRWIFP